MPMHRQRPSAAEIAAVGGRRPSGHRPSPPAWPWPAAAPGPRPPWPAGPAVGHRPIVLVNADLTATRPATTCSTGTSTAALDRVTAVGLGARPTLRRWRTSGRDLAGPGRRAEAAAPARRRTPRDRRAATGTNVQEAGVDEPDVVKTDGDLLVRIQDGDAHDLRRHRRRARAALGARPPGADRRRRETAAVRRPRGRRSGHDGRRTAAASTATGSRPAPGCCVVDLADPATPRSSTRSAYDAAWSPRASTATRSGWSLDRGLPDLDFVAAADRAPRNESARSSATGRSSATARSRTGCRGDDATAGDDRRAVARLRGRRDPRRRRRSRHASRSSASTPATPRRPWDADRPWRPTRDASTSRPTTCTSRPRRARRLGQGLLATRRSTPT